MKQLERDFQPIFNRYLNCDRSTETANYFPGYIEYFSKSNFREDREYKTSKRRWQHRKPLETWSILIWKIFWQDIFCISKRFDI